MVEKNSSLENTQFLSTEFTLTPVSYFYQEKNYEKLSGNTIHSSLKLQLNLRYLYYLEIK